MDNRFLTGVNEPKDSRRNDFTVVTDVEERYSYFINLRQLMMFDFDYDVSYPAKAFESLDGPFRNSDLEDAPDSVRDEDCVHDEDTLDDEELRVGLVDGREFAFWFDEDGSPAGAGQLGVLVQGLFDGCSDEWLHSIDSDGRDVYLLPQETAFVAIPSWAFRESQETHLAEVASEARFDGTSTKARAQSASVNLLVDKTERDLTPA